MKKITKLLFTTAFLSLSLLACQAPKEEASSEGSSTGEDTATEVEAATTTTVLNANLATEEDLNGIGLSAEMVAQILENRPFLTMNDFDVLVDAGADKEDLYKKIFVPFNLNTTAEADFKMIPGVGDRMAHEFEEYRPYSSIEQFRKEIGKYVDDKELARLERFVYLKQ